jgi:hypothetical protein
VNAKLQENAASPSPSRTRLRGTRTSGASDLDLRLGFSLDVSHAAVRAALPWLNDTTSQHVLHDNEGHGRRPAPPLGRSVIDAAPVLALPAAGAMVVLKRKNEADVIEPAPPHERGLLRQAVRWGAHVRRRRSRTCRRQGRFFGASRRSGPACG